MPVSKAKHAANERYNAKAYDRIMVRVPKGEKEKLAAYIKSRGESMNGFLLRSINETIARDSKEEKE